MFSYRQSVLQNGSKIIISSLGCLYSYIVEFWWCRNGVPIEWNESVSVGYSGLFVHCPGSVKHFMKSSINLVLSKVSNVCVWGGYNYVWKHFIVVRNKGKQKCNLCKVLQQNSHNRSQERTAKEVVVQHTDSQRMTRNCNSIGEKVST